MQGESDNVFKYSQLSSGTDEAIRRSCAIGYDESELDSIPQQAILGAGCGVPLQSHEFKNGDVIVDIGCGAGIDSFLSAKRVGPCGKVFGIDADSALVERARDTAQASGYSNVEFLHASAERLPLSTSIADFVITNCAFNLVTNKQLAVREVFRILKPGGKFLFSDVFLTKPIEQRHKDNDLLTACCISGAISINEAERYLKSAGFELFYVDDQRPITRDFIPSIEEETAKQVLDHTSAFSARLVAIKPNAPEQPSNGWVCIIGSSHELVPLVRQRNYEPLMVSSTNQSDADSCTTLHIDFHQEDAPTKIVDWLKKIGGCDHIVTVDGYLTELTSTVAGRLGLAHTSSIESVRTATDKHQTRMALQQAGLATPRFETVCHLDQTYSASVRVGFPLVAKPTNDSNSRHVHYCRNEIETASAIKAILETQSNLGGQPLEKTVLLEEYIDGPEYSVEVVAIQGEYSVVTICEKLLGPLPFFVEVGHIAPAPLPLNLKTAIEDAAINALKIINVNTTVAHVEVRVRQGIVYIIEVNLRPAGGKLREFIRDVTNTDLYALAIDSSIGDKNAIRAFPSDGRGVYHCITAPRIAKLEYKTELLRQYAKKVRIEMEVPPGQIVYPVNHSRGRILGRILIVDDSIPKAWEAIREIKIALGLRFIPIEMDSFEAVENQCGCWDSGCC